MGAEYENMRKNFSIIPTLLTIRIIRIYPYLISHTPTSGTSHQQYWNCVSLYLVCSGRESVINPLRPTDLLNSLLHSQYLMSADPYTTLESLSGRSVSGCMYLLRY